MFARLTKVATLAVASAAFLVISANATPAAAAPHGHGHFVVHYTPPADNVIHLHNHAQAHRMANFIRSVGVRAHVHHEGHGYDVHFGGYGSRTRCFDCDQEAHAFEARLQRLGFDAHVHH